MPTLESTYQKVNELKKERRVITSAINDELNANTRYQELQERIAKDREEAKSIKNTVLANADVEKLNGIKLELASMTEMLADIALNLYVEGQSVAVEDPQQGTLSPRFSVRFKK